MGDNDRNWTKCQKGGWERALRAVLPYAVPIRCAGLHANRDHWDALECILQHAVRHLFTCYRGPSAEGLPRAAAAATGSAKCRQVTAGYEARQHNLAQLGSAAAASYWAAAVATAAVAAQRQEHPQVAAA